MVKCAHAMKWKPSILSLEQYADFKNIWQNDTKSDNIAYMYVCDVLSVTYVKVPGKCCL